LHKYSLEIGKHLFGGFARVDVLVPRLAGFVFLGQPLSGLAVEAAAPDPAWHKGNGQKETDVATRRATRYGYLPLFKPPPPICPSTAGALFHSDAGEIPQF
jgi:hypothetical protein